MSNFTPLVTHEFQFEDDKVTIVFSRLKRKHMLAAMPALKRLRDSMPDETEIPNIDDVKQDNPEMAEAINDVLNSIVDVIPEYVESMSGLLDADGNPISIETVCEEFYFVGLAAQISTLMLQVSSGKEGKA